MFKIENEAIKEKAETVINSSKHLKHIEKLNAEYGTNWLLQIPKLGEQEQEKRSSQ